MGVAAGKSIKPHLRHMVSEYYERMGWKDARPTVATLERVGLAGEV